MGSIRLLFSAFGITCNVAETKRVRSISLLQTHQ